MIVLYRKQKMHPVNCGNNLQSAKSLDASIRYLATHIMPHLKKKSKNYCTFFKNFLDFVQEKTSVFCKSRGKVAYKCQM